MFHCRPLLKPLYDSLVRSAKKKAELVAKPLTLRMMPFCIPRPEPKRITNIKMPQKTPKQVNKLRVLLRVIVTQISVHLSKSNIAAPPFLLRAHRLDCCYTDCLARREITRQHTGDDNQ